MAGRFIGSLFCCNRARNHDDNNNVNIVNENQPTTHFNNEPPTPSNNNENNIILIGNEDQYHNNEIPENDFFLNEEYTKLAQNILQNTEARQNNDRNNAYLNYSFHKLVDHTNQKKELLSVLTYQLNLLNEIYDICLERIKNKKSLTHNELNQYKIFFESFQNLILNRQLTPEAIKLFHRFILDRRGEDSLLLLNDAMQDRQANSSNLSDDIVKMLEWINKNFAIYTQLTLDYNLELFLSRALPNLEFHQSMRPRKS